MFKMNGCSKSGIQKYAPKSHFHVPIIHTVVMFVRRFPGSVRISIVSEYSGASSVPEALESLDSSLRSSGTAQRCDSWEYFPLELRWHAVDSIHILEVIVFRICCVLHVFLTSTDLCAFLVSGVVHFFQHLFSCGHGTHCISLSRLDTKAHCTLDTFVACFSLSW